MSDIISLATAPKTTGETVVLRLMGRHGDRIIAAYFNETQRAWCWLNGHSGICWIDEAIEDREIAGWAPLTMAVS